MADIAPIVRRLKSLVETEVKESALIEGDFLTSFFDKDNTWVFSEKLTIQAQADTALFKPLVHEHRLLTVEYSVLRAGLARDLTAYFPPENLSETDTPNGSNISGKQQKKLSPRAEAELIRKVQAALALSVALEHVYRDYLKVPREEARFLRDQREYRDWLANQWDFKFNPSFLEPAPTVDVGASSSQIVQVTTRQTNPFRLLGIRLWRWLVFMGLVLNDAEHYGRWVGEAGKYVGPFFSYVAWIFFLPRLVVNTGLLCKHVIDHPWMDDKERSLGWYTRLRGQLARRWPAMTNDIAWFTSGIIACFILTGKLLPIAIYFAIAMQSFDLLNASLRAYLEITRLQDLEQTYIDMRKEHPSQRREINGHLKNVRQRIQFEQQVLILSLVNFGVLLLAICLTLPVLAVISPLFPLVGASLAILMTVINYAGAQSLENTRIKLYDVRFPQAPESKKPYAARRAPANSAPTFGSLFYPIDSKSGDFLSIDSSSTQRKTLSVNDMTHTPYGLE